MKKIIFFSLFCLFLMSCGGAGKAPTDYITLSKAFSICSATASYWIWLIITIIAASVTAFFLIRAYLNNADWPIGYSLILFAFGGLILLAIFMRPCEVAANTTVEQAARGAYIGY